MIVEANLLAWYGMDMTEQDYNLLQFVTKNKIEAIKYLGDCLSVKAIIKKESNNPQLCVFLVNQSFKFSELVNICNNEIKRMQPGSFFYLAINKFHAIPEPHLQLPDDYDDAIYEYIKNKINYPLIDYHSGKDDYGQKFNWGHPLTRFYFSNANSI